MQFLADLDHRFVWHPFTQMREWLNREPIVIVEGHGAVLRDVNGREYLDANSSIWTNLHGHNSPPLNAAIGRQLKKIAHSSALGLANEPASLLAEQLVQAANPKSIPHAGHRSGAFLGKVFFSDDGSTAVEVALKMAYEFVRRTGHSQKPRFLSLQGAYHGDTVGAVSLGHIDLFHKTYSGLLFRTDQVPAPYCYRCRFNRAKPERADARDYRRCNWECLDVLQHKFERERRRRGAYAAFVVEPLIQGAAGMIPQPVGWLKSAAAIARSYGTLLIADEVMTGFGRTGMPMRAAPTLERPCSQKGIRREIRAAEPGLFACHSEGVQPDFLALAKGLSGGYLPLAATLTTQRVFNAFLGGHHEFKTFFHGHSYTANQLGSAAALASLKVLRSRQGIRARQKLERSLKAELHTLWKHPNVGDIRQVGLVAGIELVKNWRTRERFGLRERAGARVCEAMAGRGVLTRPIGDVIVIMPPYCASAEQVRAMVRALGQAVASELGGER